MSINSAIVIARLLSTEGFSDHVSGEIKRYALRQATRGQRQRWKNYKRAFSELVLAKLSEADRLVLGKMIGVMCKMHFDTGLRMGLTAFACEHPKPMPAHELREEPDPCS